MELKITNKHITEYEKDLGGDDGRPMITMLRFRHWTITSDEDVRPHIKERQCSWYNCHLFAEKGSPLEQALLNLVGRDYPGLSGIRSVSEDGREIEFCWR